MMTAGPVARDIADEIETKGHYQGVKHAAEPGSVCLVTSETYMETTSGMKRDAEPFKAALADKIGVELPVAYIDTDGFEYRGAAPLITWNDSTPTEVVLETLRNL